MIDHDAARRSLSAELDGALDATAAAELADHLDGCDPCRAHRERLVAVRAELARPPEPEPDVTARVLAAVAARGAAGDPAPTGPASNPGGGIGHEVARQLLSAELDGALDGSEAAELAAHLDGCGACRAHRDRLAALHAALARPADEEPDVARRVLATVAADGRAPSPPVTESRVTTAGATTRPTDLASRRRSWSVRWLPAAACLVVGLLIGSLLVGGWRSTPEPAAAEVPEHVAAAQFGLTSLAATIEITERGWNPDVPARSFTGTLDYEAPETLGLHLRDTTAYPSASWVPNDVDLVRRDQQWWARGPRDCPSSDQPGCTSPQPRLEVVDAVAPYDDGVAVPLDLVVPVRSFLRAGEPAPLGTQPIEGRAAVGVEVTAAQVAPLLDGLRPAGNLRQFFPTDRVALWLDATSWTPVRIEVDASDDPDRRTWAVNRGYADQPGDRILEVALRDLRIGSGADRSRIGEAPAGGVRRDAGFAPESPGAAPTGTGPQVVVDPATIPDGLVPGTGGVIGPGGEHEALVQTWSGGRGWVKVTATGGWDGDRLYGDLGSPVRRLDGPDGSVRYASLDGARIGIHAPGVDAVVTGSLDEATLDAIAAGLDVVGTAVPEGWADAATETIPTASQLLPGVLVPAPSAGLGPAAVRADGNVVTQAYAGAGGRGVVVVEAPGERLAPPLDLDVGGVVVRGVEGRYSATRGELEWVDGTRVHRLASTTMSRAELLALADAMRPA